MDFMALQIIFGVLCTLYAPLTQTADDKYIITANRQNFQNDIYMYKGDFTSLSKTSVTPFKLRWESVVQDIDVDVANSTIFLLDKSCVFSIRLLNSSTFSNNATMHCGISNSLKSSIAYDWVTGNMYWSDGIFQWIAVSPMYTTDTQMYRIIIQEVKNISALAVDPINRYIFWFDNSPSGSRIERASLTGQQRKTILTNGLLLVYDIFADATSKQIFWLDYHRYSIESSKYDGSQRTLLYKILTVKLFSLAVDEVHVCATVPKHKSWICVDKNSGDHKYEKREPREPYRLAIFNKAMQPQDKSNFCASASCQHFCVNGVNESICMCKEGYSLNQDGKNCSAKHDLFGKGILISYKKQICILDYKAIVHGRADDFNCTHTGLQGVENLEVNVAELMVFYYDSVNGLIKSYDLRSRISKTIQGSTGIVSGLSFDWNQKTLYWCESNSGIIGRVSLRNNVTDVFLDSDKDVNDVSVDPHKRTVFWIEGKTTILVSKMKDGKNQNILVEGETKTCLFFEINSRRIYWIQTNGIVSAKEDGSDIHRPISASNANQLLIFKSYFIWISGNRTLSTLRTTSDNNIKKIILPDNDTITGIAVFDENSQPIERGACDVNNGGCDHICIAVINGSVCRCQFGFTLDSDGKTCETVPLNQSFLLATDVTHSRIYQVALQSGSIRTLDLPLVENPTAVRYDSARRYLYWASSIGLSGTIKRATIDGKNQTTIYTAVFGTFFEGIDLDPNSGYLYFIAAAGSSSLNNGYLGVIDTHRLYIKTLLTRFSLGAGLAIYPSKGILFFTYREGNTSHIYRAPIDGSSRAKIRTAVSVYHIYDLTIDYNADRLYWSEYNQLWSGDLSALNVNLIVTTKLAIRCMVLDHPYIYYHSDEYTKIIKFDLIKKQPVSWMSDMPDIGYLYSLDIYPKATMPGNFLCANRNGMCSTLCLPSEKSITCGCIEGVSLLSDGKTCDGVRKCSEPVQFGSLEATCQRYSGETCNFTCKSDYIPKVQPQTVTCEENGIWNHDLSDLCSETLVNDTPTTNMAAIVGGAVAAVIVVFICVVGAIIKLRRKKPASVTKNVPKAPVFNF